MRFNRTDRQTKHQRISDKNRQTDRQTTPKGPKRLSSGRPTKDPSGCHMHKREPKNPLKIRFYSKGTSLRVVGTRIGMVAKEVVWSREGDRVDRVEVSYRC